LISHDARLRPIEHGAGSLQPGSSGGLIIGFRMTVPFIFCASITAISAIISLGFSIAAALGATGTARTMALYACARSVALMIASAVPFLTGSTGWLQAIAWSMIIVQACDAVIGTTIKDRMKTFGPAGTALANLVAVIWLMQTIP
jgi:hypothetical protein